MAKQYTYDPRKYQSGGVTPPSMGSIQQGPTFMQNLGSDIRSVIKYPMESARAFLYELYKCSEGVTESQYNS